MRTSLVARWTAARCAQQLWVWALALALLSLWPALQLLAPFGVLSAGASAAYEIAFAGAVAGIACALHAIEELRSWSHSLGLRTGALAEWSTLCVAGVLFQFLALATPCAASCAQHEALGIALPLAAIVASAHLACGGLAILRAPLPGGTRAFTLIVMAWLVPAIAGSSSILSLFHPIPAFAGASSFRIVFFGELMSMLALIFAAQRLESSRRRDP
jgi:hypothetical protein